MWRPDTYAHTKYTIRVPTKAPVPRVRDEKEMKWENQRNERFAKQLTMKIPQAQTEYSTHTQQRYIIL